MKDISNDIAIVGMALRFPGADSPETFWHNLANGVESITRFTRDELLAAGIPPEKLEDPTYVPAAGCLDEIELFDAELFGFSSREAELMDPQQRLFLTVAREALEAAGFASGMTHNRVGVFAGSSISTYLLYNLHGLLDQSGSDLNIAKLVVNDKDYLATLTAHKLDLRGPAITVQTACSTSLVAVHQACQALLSLECDAALAGGVTVRVPHRVGYSNQGGSMLSAQGRCRAFDAEADGTVPGSGCGVVVLKRLSDAQRDGDPIMAVILGSAVNNDGADKIGFTAPSISGQVDAVVNAQAMAGVTPQSIGYIEAHGTGTSLGDPIEIAALTQAMDLNSQVDNCALGSVKTNLGHLECAAGIAGLIKTVLAVKHGQIPPSLGYLHANPESGLERSPFFVNDRLRDWPERFGLRRAGVSSFGFGGTNCHMVVEQAPLTSVSEDARQRRLCLLPLSARQPHTLTELRARYINFLHEPETPSVADICFSAATTRQHEAHRSVISGDSSEALLSGLRDWSHEIASPSYIGSGVVPDKLGLRAFLFTGQGSVYPGMGRALLEHEPVFRDAVRRCDEILSKWLDRPISEIFTSAEDDSSVQALLNNAQYAQPAVIVLQYALAELWASWGIQPDFVMGHSLGEYAAAAVAGGLSLTDALQLVVRRAALMQGLDQTGSMLTLFASEAEARTLFCDIGDVEIAVVNGPKNVILGGSSEALSKLAKKAAVADIATKELQTTHAFHTALMDPILDQLEVAATEVDLLTPRVTLVSTRTGSILSANEHTATHWREHCRDPVRFAEGIKTLAAANCRTFLELGPHPVLCGLGRGCIGSKDYMWHASLRQGADAVMQIYRSLGELYLGGAEVNWPAVFPSDLRRVAVPTMPVRGSRHWLEPVRRTRDFDHGAGLLGHKLPSAVLAGQYETRLSTQFHSFLADHAVADGAIFPATGYFDLILTAARGCLGADRAILLRDVKIAEPLMLDDNERTVQTVLQTTKQGLRAEVFSQGMVDTQTWAQHCGAYAEVHEQPDVTAIIDLAELRKRCDQQMSQTIFYSEIRRRQMFYGPAFQLIENVHMGEGIALARVSRGTRQGGAVDPALLDACCQAAGTFFLNEPDTDNFLPVLINRVLVHDELPDEVFSRAELRRIDSSGAVVDITVCDASGRIFAELSGMQFCRITRKAGAASEASAIPKLYTPVWQSVDQPEAQRVSGRWLIIAETDAQARPLVSALRETGAKARVVTFDSVLQPTAARELIASDTNAGAVLLWPRRHGPKSRETAMMVTLHVSQAMIDNASTLPLFIVTANVHRIGPQAVPSLPDQALVWGFADSLREEHPELRHRLVDLDTTDTADAVEPLLIELANHDNPEDRVAWRDGIRLCRRLAPRRETPTGPYRLHPSRSGMLDQMSVTPLTLTEPGPGELRLQVRATGLNFRDVINALGMLPSNSSPLGGESAGIVDAVGAGVDESWIGRRVVCGAGGAFSSHVVCDQRLVTPIPDDMSFEHASVLPIAYVTALHALVKIAQLAPGERVLIHSGAGGVGQAAIAIAKARGAEIFATAGSPRKRAFLRELGIEHVFDSRSLKFADEIRTITAGDGVDVVLNALSDDFIPAGFELLRKGGRFLEIGKLGIWSPERVAQKYPDVSYHIIALDRLIAESPDEVQSLMAEVMAAFATGEWTLPRLRVFDFTEVSEAFRFMQQARHIGKIAVRHSTSRPVFCREDATYLISGGSGALGLETAAWLIGRGAQHLVLTSRNKPEAAQIAALQAEGATVIWQQADLTKKDAAKELLASIRATGRPLCGVIHAAGVIEDAPIIKQDWESFCRVLGPKIIGAEMLSQETASDPLDFFILYSSASGELGAAGQGAYAAANSYLDALAERRTMLGLPGLSMAWGPWPIGMTTTLSEANQKRMASFGIATPSSNIYFELMEYCAAGGDARAIALAIDWGRFLKRPGQEARRDRLIGIATTTNEASADTENWVVGLEALPIAARREALTEKISELAAYVVGRSDNRPAPNMSLLELGIDSLMAVEFRNTLAEALGQRLPATLLFDYPSPEQIAEYFIQSFFNWTVIETGDEADSASNPIDAMNDETAVAVIAAELERWSQINE